MFHLSWKENVYILTVRIDFQSTCLLIVFCCAQVSLFTEMDIANIKMRNYSLSFNPWLQYLTNKLCSKRNVMIIRIFLRLLRHTLFSTYSCTLIIKVCFHCFSFYQEAKLKQEQEVGFMRFFVMLDNYAIH